MTAGVLHLLAPGGVCDPLRTSGGNTYDRRLCGALAESGWRVDLVEVEGGWPWAPEVGSRALERALRALPDGAHVVVDGLLASRLPAVMVPASGRLRVVLLMHLPAGVEDDAARPAERAVLAAATAVVTPSAWCRDWLVREYGVDPARAHVALPGADPARVAGGAGTGTCLLSVGTVAAVKGQDRLLAALDRVRDLAWRWTCVGATTVEPRFADRLRDHAHALGLEDRIEFAGRLAGDGLETAYAGTDLLAVPSRHETYGMVVTEALARGVPVVAHDVGGVREALGTTSAGEVPGILVRPGQPDGLAAALRLWLTHADVRTTLRMRALERRTDLAGWDATADRVADLVREVAA